MKSHPTHPSSLRELVFVGSAQAAQTADLALPYLAGIWTGVLQ